MQSFISKIRSFVKLAYGTVQPKVVAVPMQAWLVIGFGAACFLGGCVCAKADESALACPVAGSQCKCGCLSGQQCSSCASKAKPKPADLEPVSNAEFQRLQYELLSDWCRRNPGREVSVYVQASPPPRPLSGPPDRCRYDAGWPQLKTPTRIRAIYRDGGFWEIGREVVNADGSPAPARPAPLMLQPAFSFGTTACRSCR